MSHRCRAKSDRAGPWIYTGCGRRVRSHGYWIISNCFLANIRLIFLLGSAISFLFVEVQSSAQFRFSHHPGDCESQQHGPAFPGAEGFGANSAGGRGGRMLTVTNLNDSGPGSLRAAVQTAGPREVIFRVAGVIELASPLDVRKPYLTVSGHTAPGDGICLKNFGIRIRDTHDVVIRYLRVRPGNALDKEGDALLIYRSQDVIVDHCSLSWSVDEVVDISDDWREPIEGGKTDNVTVQWCIISESLNNSFHAKGDHGFAALISAIRDGDVTLHHNLFAHHLTRVPRPGGRRGTPGLRLEFRNNVIYNWGSPQAGYSADSETAAEVQLTYTDNYLKPGPSTPAKGRHVAFSSAATTKIYAAGNRVEGFDAASADNWLIFKPRGKIHQLLMPLHGPLRIAETAAQAFERVLEDSGAILPRRDAIDQRIVRQVRETGGRLIDSPKEVGGWPRYGATHDGASENR